MKLLASGVISAAEPGTPRAVAKQCHLAAYPDGEILVTYRVGAASDSEHGNAEIRDERPDEFDGAASWDLGGVYQQAWLSALYAEAKRCRRASFEGAEMKNGGSVAANDILPGAIQVTPSLEFL